MGQVGSMRLPVILLPSAFLGTLAGYDDSDPSIRSFSIASVVEVNHGAAVTQQMELGNRDAATVLASRALVKSPDNLSATIIAVEAEAAGVGNPQVAIGLSPPQEPQASGSLVQQCFGLNT